MAAGIRPDPASGPGPATAPAATGRCRAPRVIAVAADPRHRFSKPVRPVIRLLAGLGVEGDAHLGVTVQHRSRVRADPTAANLRQVHLIAGELLDELALAGHPVGPGELGENLTTRDLDLLALPTGTVLRVGAQAAVEVTGLRHPCRQIDGLQPGLLRRVVGRTADGAVVRRAGVMGVVRTGGEVRPGDGVVVVLPPPPHRPLDRV